MTRPNAARRLLTALVLGMPLMLSSSASTRSGDGEAGTCQANPDPALEAQAEAARARARALATLAEKGADDTQVVVLNGRGYNYGAESYGPGDASGTEAGAQPPASGR